VLGYRRRSLGKRYVTGENKKEIKTSQFATNLFF